MMRFHSLPFPLIILIAFLLMLAVGAGAPAWATPDQSLHNQTIPTPTPAPTATPTSGPCGPTEVLSGVIDTDTIWYRACSPYTIRGNLLVASGVRLSIEPETEVRFEGTFLQVDGELHAEGTAQSQIVFRGGNTNTTWAGIRFSDSSVDYNPTTGTGSIISYAIITDAYQYGQSAITASNACPRVTNNDITRFAYYGIQMRCSQGGEIRNNIIHGDSAQHGVWALDVSGQVTVDGNEIYGVGYSQNTVVTIQNGVIFTHNSIHDNIVLSTNMLNI